MARLAVEPVVLLDLDFGDAELVVREYPDGMVTLQVPGGQLLVNAEQFRQIVKSMVLLGRERGWIAEADGS